MRCYPEMLHLLLHPSLQNEAKCSQFACTNQLQHFLSSYREEPCIRNDSSDFWDLDIDVVRLVEIRGVLAFDVVAGD